MNLTPAKKREPAENTLSLINIVFLMLIFFLVAGHISTKQAGDVKLTELKFNDSSKPPSDAIGITAKGEIFYKGRQVNKVELLGVLRAARAQDVQIFRLMPDRHLPASQLVDILEIIGQAGYLKAKIISLRRRGG